MVHRYPCSKIAIYRTQMLIQIMHNSDANVCYNCNNIIYVVIMTDHYVRQSNNDFIVGVFECSNIVCLIIQNLLLKFHITDFSGFS